MKKYTVIIIGSGFGGQCAAINLLKKGITDFHILERRSFMGGTWCQNTYPGAAVDVHSPLYSFSFDPYPWTQMFAKQSELEDYTNFIIKKYELKEKTKLNTTVIKIEWVETAKNWQVTTNNESFLAQFVINATGPLSTPVIPNFKGKDDFEGVSFHTNNWNHNYDYNNKKVAVIGSGASAAQVIPAIADQVNKLHIFQRTPHWILPRPDKIFSSFQQKLLRVKWIYKLIRYIIYWSLENRIIGFKYSRFFLKIIAQRKAVGFINKVFQNHPELKNKLLPDYTIGCKRVLLSNTLYPTFLKENVHLFDNTQGIKEIHKTGIISNQNEQIELDLIIYATGFDATDGLISYPVIGKKNTAIQDTWAEYPRAYLGTSLPNFPNLFIVTGPNTGIGHTSAIFIIECQMNYILDCILKVKNKSATTIEVKTIAEERYTAMIHREMKKTVWYDGNCNSWYKSKSGHVVAMFPGFSFTYRWLTKHFKNEDHVFN